MSKDLSETPNFYLADIAGLDSKSTLDLRRACFKSNIRISVVKNTLLKKAMEDSGKEFGDLKTTLKGNTSVMFSEKGNIPAKLIKDFRKKFDKPILKGAFVEESIYIGDDKINVLADLKSKDEIIGEIKNYKFDILIRCGSGILKGKILHSSKYGIISFEDGEFIIPKLKIQILVFLERVQMLDSCPYAVH